MLELREAAQFDHGALGWGEWKDAALRDSKEEFSFFEEGEEVARIRIYPQYRLRAPYDELPPGVYVCADLVVVRSDKQGQGRGPKAVALMANRYAGQTMIAFSAADSLWEDAGWVRAVRTDGDDLAWPLFFQQV